jgi:hypothetical protein
MTWVPRAGGNAGRIRNAYPTEPLVSDFVSFNANGGKK